jgi:hypothetical protein
MRHCGSVSRGRHYIPMRIHPWAKSLLACAQVNRVFHLYGVDKVVPASAESLSPIIRAATGMTAGWPGSLSVSLVRRTRQKSPLGAVR